MRDGSDTSLPQDWPAQRRVFAQGQVGTRRIVIVGLGAQQPTLMRLVEDDQMIQALSADRPDKPFDMGILPGRAWDRWAIPDPHGSEPFPECLTVGAVAVSDEISRGRIPRKCL